MINLNVSNLIFRYLHFVPRSTFQIPFIFLLHTHSLPHHKDKPTNWNASHVLIQSNPLLSLLEACSSMAQMKQIHAQMISTGLISDGFALSRLVAFCAISEWRNLDYCDKILNNAANPNVFSWNMAIRGYIESENPRYAVLLYRNMLRKGSATPDNYTYPLLFKVCAGFSLSCTANEILGHVIQLGFDSDLFVHNAIIHVLVSCGELLAARKVFDESCVRDLVSWNSIINGYCKNIEAAKILFENMPKKTVVSWTIMVVGYAKFGLLESAVRLFNEMPEKDVVPWNALIGGFVQAKRSKEALALFHEMQASNVAPDGVTAVNCLSACSQLGALDVGIWMHHYVDKHDLTMNVALGTALVDMYAKCGNIKKAIQVFEEMPGRNSLTWTAIICGLALHGQAHAAISYFSEMISIGLVPDEITFIGVLSACCHGGLVDQGRDYFYQMSSKFGISPKLKHYSCLVDLLGRAGFLEEAEELIRSMPFEPDAVVWGALFFGSRIHGNVHMGERAASKLLELDPHDSGIYVLLANMYGDANMWEQARKVRKMMEERGVEKTPGCSSIEMNGLVYEFIIRDKSHPQSEKIYECLTWLTRQLEVIEVDTSLFKEFSSWC
uniref:Pentatricopeptide repeat-containing protein n=1 Tax=Cucumis melo TaxID=3656 RepID=A0A9I9DAG0_CUCME